MKQKNLYITFALILSTILIVLGSHSAMSNKIIELKWEWPANRHLENKILINVEKISKPSKGFFGIGGSPSLADTLPDARDVVGTVTSGVPDMVGKVISIRIPGVEAKKLAEGTPAAIALINLKTGICIASSPPDVKGRQSWFEKWSCD